MYNFFVFSDSHITACDLQIIPNCEVEDSCAFKQIVDTQKDF